MRVCRRCGLEKDEVEFNYRNKSKEIRQFHCRVCTRIYIKSHYLRNKEYYLRKAYKRNIRIRNEIKGYIWTYLKDHPCVDCGENDPIVLEFDHTSDKVANISEMYRNYTLEKVKLEIDKCQIRCANCHRRKTAKELGWNKKYLLL